MTTEDRKMEIAWKTTPSELRTIASYLERDGCNQVRVNWYHTRLCFVLDKPKEGIPSAMELDGETDGSIVAKDVDQEAQCSIIDAAQYLNSDGIQGMIDYLKSLREHRAALGDAS